ncbi:MAG: methionine--tRNA ligase subunit beta, partial [Candidatus Eisenbacteria bacterium]|nr:methionine--tRNA ligase subunit beta [Candidatus Eisenbacteria bacterium]
ANDLGNLVSRATAMVVKFLGGTIEDAATRDRAAPGALPELAGTARAAVIEAMDGYAPQVALAAIWELVRGANAFIEEEKPWVLAKENPGRVVGVLFSVLETIRQVAILSWPVIPGKSEEILASLGLALSPGETSLADLLRWGAGWPDRIEISKPAAVFPKFTDEELAHTFDIASGGAAAGNSEAALARPDGTDTAKTDTPQTETTEREGDRKMLSFDRLKELDLRLARITDAAKVEDTTKLIRMTVDLGEGDERQMVAGIAEGYAAEELIGRMIVVVANLEPAKIRGIESQAMLLAAVGDGGISLVAPDKELPPGTRVS